MKRATTVYEIKKDGTRIVFNSEKEACEFIGVLQCSVASCFRSKCKCKGWDLNKIGLSTHGGTRKERLYKIWGGIKERCYREKHPHYKNYGGRGIKMCNDWMQYEPFRDWALSNGYGIDLTIDRIDVNGNYEPNNCRWATDKQQGNNKRTNHIVCVLKEEMTLTQCSEKYGIPKSTVRYLEKVGKLESKCKEKIGGANMKEEQNH